MVKTILFLILYGYTAFYAQDTGKITGSVKTFSGNPAELVNVILKGTLKGDITNSQGVFEITGVEPGKYILEFSLIGFKKVDLETEVLPGKTIEVPVVTLYEAAAELTEITVEDRRVNKYSVAETDYISKLPVKNLENPQSYSTGSKELFKQQNITNYSSALQTIPGGAVSVESPQGLSGIFIRGFVTNSFIRNGLYSFSWNGGDPQVIERLEIIRGPSGPVYGTWGVGYGGLLNVVTKKPVNTTYAEAGITLGSYNLQRYTVDYNTPVNENNSLLFRINLAAHSEESFQDFGYKKTYLAAPSLYYRINDNLSLLIEAEFNILDYSSQTLFAGAAALGINRIDEINRNYFKSYNSNNLSTEPGNLNNYFARLEYDFSPNWSLNTNIALADFSLTGSNIIPNFINDSLLSRRLYDFSSDINTISIQPNITGSFYIGGIRNRLLAGFDYQWVDVTSGGSIALTVDTVNYLRNVTPVINAQQVRLNYNINLHTNESRNSYAAYVSDEISFSDRVNLLLSLRYDYNDYNGIYDIINGILTTQPNTKNTLSPQAGFTWQILKDQLSLFANYMHGYNYVAADRRGNSFDPETAAQIEGGIKLNFFNNRIYSTISYYNISVTDKVRPSGTDPLASVQDGEQISKGVDMDLRINPFIGFNLIAGYTYNISTLTKAIPAIEGNRPAATPENTFNFWADYSLPAKFLNGFTIGAGAVFVDELYFDDANSLLIPSFSLFKASLSYRYSGFSINLAFENITDKRYWDYNGTPQMPFRMLLHLGLIL